MKKAFYFAFIAALTLFACTKEETNPSEEKDTTPEVPGATVFTASIESSVKTSLDGLKVNWVEDDEIKIMWDGGSATAEASKDGADATFKAVVDDADAYYAVYPSSRASFDGTNITATIPAEQTGAFADSDIMLAKTTDGATLPFKHLAGIIRFTLNDATVTSVKIKADDDVALAGSGTVTFNEYGIPSFALSGDGDKEITISTSGAGTYYATVIPGITLGGFYFELTSPSGTKTVFSPKDLSITRAYFKSMGDIDDHVVVDWFVTPSGAGKKNGVSWENAFGLDEIAAIFTGQVTADNLAVYGGGTFHFAGGTYSLTDKLSFDFTKASSAVAMTFKGGYNPASTGVNKSDRDLASYATNIDGASSTDGQAMRIDQHTNLSFDGINVNNFSTGVSTIYMYTGAETPDVTASFTHCSFSGNGVNTNTAGNKYGGVFYQRLGTLNITSCTFEDNASELRGGAIVAAGNADLTITGTVEDKTVFSDNSAGVRGGAIYLEFINGEANISYAEFSRNSANSGGAISQMNNKEYEMTTNLTSCVFDNNSGAGAVVEAYNAGVQNINLTNCEIKNNTVKSFYTAGGAIVTIDGAGTQVSGNSAVLMDGTPLIIKAGTFSSNTGRIYAGTGAVTIDGGIFTENSSSYGGLFYGEGTYIINGGTFKKNQASNSGGVIHLKGAGSVTINGGTFGGDSASEANTAATNGGVVYLEGSSSATINGGLFKYNSATGYGGAIGVGSTGTITITNSISTPQLLNNTASEGGAIRISTGTASIEGATFSNNSATTGGGGAILVAGAGSLEINGGSFIGNVCSTIGGAVGCIDGQNITLVVDGTSFTGNSSQNGGAIRFSRGSAKINGATFTSNTATTFGGAINLASGLAGGSPVFINGCKFTGNSTDGGGSGSTGTAGGSVIRVASNYVGINNCAFYANASNKVDLLICSSANVLLSNTTFVTSGSGNNANPICNHSGVSPRVNLVNCILKTPGYCVNTRKKDDVSSSYASGSNIDHSFVIGVSTSYYKDRNTYCALVTPSATWDAGFTSGGNTTYQYSGSLSDFTDFTPMTTSTQTYISNLGTDNDTAFATWLGTVDGFTKDIDGNARPNAEGKYWPGCYQK